MKVPGLLAVLLMVGCAHQQQTPAGQEPETIGAVPQIDENTHPAQAPVLSSAPVPTPVPTPGPAPGPAPAPTPGAGINPATGAAAAPPPVKPRQTQDAARSKAASAAPRLAAPALPSVAAASSSPKPVATLDLAALEQQLRDTRAIGVFTKLSLKNQVDDLLDTVREYHSGQGRGTLQDARQRYDSLLIKVLGLLQNGDPALASSIRGSREAIWNLLADRDQFQKMHL